MVCGLAASANEVCKKPAPQNRHMQDWPASPLSNYKLDNDTKLGDLVKYFFEWGVGLGGLAVFIALIIAGIEYITSIADPGKLNDAKDRIKSSLIGLVLLLSSWAIFNIINPSLNTLSRELPEMQKGGYFVTKSTCGYAFDCCRISGCVDADCPAANPNCCFNPNCVVKNWRCCRRNDTNCIERGKDPAVLKGTVAEGATCGVDSECASGLCSCDKSDWTKKCAPNPQVCIATMGQPEMGCDVVRFYKSPDLTSVDTPVPCPSSTADNCYMSSGNTGWKDVGFNPKSYQAFSYAKDNSGNKIYDDGAGGVTKDNPSGTLKQKEVPCGSMGCGCAINRCLDGTVTPGLGGCTNHTADDSGNFTEFTFNTDVGETFTSVQLQDDTKTITAHVTNFYKWEWGILSDTANTVWTGLNDFYNIF